MANFHFSISQPKIPVFKKHNYNNREREYKNRKDLVKKQTFNLPQEFEDIRDFWQTALENERINGNIYYHYDLSLPKEFDDEKNWEIVTKFLEKHLEDKFVYNVALHKEGDNPNAHIMFYIGEIDGIKREKEKYFKRNNSKNPERGGWKKKSEKFYSKDGKVLIKNRKEWARHLNKYLKEAGLEKVTADSLKIQRKKAKAAGDKLKEEQLDREAIHIDRNVLIRIKKGEAKGDDLKKFEEYQNNIRIKKLKDQVYKLKKNLKQKIEEYNQYKEEKKEHINEFKRISDINLKISKNNEKIKNIENSVYNKLTNGKFSKKLNELVRINKKLKKDKQKNLQIAKDKLIKSLEAIKNEIQEDIYLKKSFDYLKSDMETNYKKSNDKLYSEREEIIKNLKEKEIDFENNEEGSINHLILLYEKNKKKFHDYIKYYEQEIEFLEKNVEEQELDEEILNEITNGEYYKFKNGYETLKEEIQKEEEKIKGMKFKFKGKNQLKMVIRDKEVQREYYKEMKSKIEKLKLKPEFKERKEKFLSKRSNKIEKYRKIKNNHFIVKNLFKNLSTSKDDNYISVYLRENETEEKFGDYEREDI